MDGSTTRLPKVENRKLSSDHSLKKEKYLESFSKIEFQVAGNKQISLQLGPSQRIFFRGKFSIKL